MPTTYSQKDNNTEPAVMVVWLHGNMTFGNSANCHLPIAQKAAADFVSEKVMSVALVRPGYPDGSGESSPGNDYGRGDNWDRANIAEVGAAIESLRLKYQPKTLMLVGHSGDAATAAVFMKSQGSRVKVVKKET